jgi:transcriptional regulator of NAD metabolism
MLHKSRKLGKEEINEIPIVESVRGLIITYLQDGKPRRYSEILRKIKKADSLVYRELKSLVEREWVIKTVFKKHSLYTLNIERLDVSTYLSKYNLIPKLNDAVYPVDVKLDDFTQILKSTPFKKLRKELGLPDQEDVENIIEALPCIDIKVVGEKIKDFSCSMKGKTEIDIDPNLDGLETQSEWIAILCLIMYNLAVLRSTQQLNNKMSDIKKNYLQGLQKKYDEGDAAREAVLAYMEEFRRQFKLIISWRPKVQESS